MTKNIRPHNGITPNIPQSVFVDSSAIIIGDVHIGEDSSVWPTSVIRGDMHRIKIGKRTSIQDGSILHITHASDFNPYGHPLSIGDECIIAHRVTLHGCTLQDQILIGMGSIVMDGAVIESNIIVGANSLVPPNKKLQSGFLYMGSPVKKIRPLSDSEIAFFPYSANNYVQLKNEYMI